MMKTILIDDLYIVFNLKVNYKREEIITIKKDYCFDCVLNARMYTHTLT